MWLHPTEWWWWYLTPFEGWAQRTHGDPAVWPHTKVWTWYCKVIKGTPEVYNSREGGDRDPVDDDIGVARKICFLYVLSCIDCDRSKNGTIYSASWSAPLKRLKESRRKRILERFRLQSK